MQGLLKFFVGVIFFITGIAALMLIPSPQPSGPKPWEVTISADDQIEVMGVQLGKSTYAAIQEQWQEAGEVALFVSDDKRISAEAFFDSLNLGGLSGRVVLNLQLPQSILETMALRATSAKLQPSGARRYDPAFEDKQRLMTAPAVALTYIPSIRLDREMVQYRFGEPEMIHSESEESQAELWHYPHLGLTIRMHPEDRTVLTYKARDF